METIKKRPISQKARVMLVMADQATALTRRKVSAITGIEIGALSRVFFELVMAGALSIARYEKCEQTKRTVGYYKLTPKVEVDNQ